MEKKKRRFGDRKDATRVRDITGLGQLCIDLKPNRSVSDVYINQKIDMTELVKYVDKKKKNGMELTYFYTFVTAIGKLLYNRPKLNRFVANRHIYEHNDVTVSFVAKVSFDDHSEELMFIIPIEPEDNLESVSKKIQDKVKASRKGEMKHEGGNKAIDMLGHLPNFIRVPVVGILKHMDKKGHLPASICSDNIYYSSIIVSNLGSIHCGAIFHNITDFGACSSLCTMGEIKNEQVLDEKGKTKVIKVCEFGVNLDERIADGYYFAKSVNMLQYIFNHPELLEERADAKVEIGEIR